MRDRFVATGEAAAVGARWARSGLWAPERVAAAMTNALASDDGERAEGTVLVKRSVRAPTFMYSEGAHQRHLLKDYDGHDDLVEVTPAAMVERMRDQDPILGPWYYYTAGCDEAFGSSGQSRSGRSNGEISGMMDGWSSLIKDQMLPRQTGMPQAPPSVWIGGAGTCTAAHYDVMDNAFVQVHGRKKFRLWGPEAVVALRVYPDLHPRARKTQLDLAATGAAAVDMSVDIVLNPGDVLHVPAFTFHQVEALEMSVSVNVFSVCRSQLHGSRILSFPVPVCEPDPSTSGRTLAHLASHVLPAFGVDSAKEFFDRVLLNGRYRPLKSSGQGDLAESTFDRKNVANAALDAGSTDMDSMLSICKVIATARSELLASSLDFPWGGYRDIIAAHLMESWALQLSGSPTLVHATLEEAASSF